MDGKTTVSSSGTSRRRSIGLRNVSRRGGLSTALRSLGGWRAWPPGLGGDRRPPRGRNRDRRRGPWALPKYPELDMVARREVWPMKDVAVVAYCRTGIARVTRGALLGLFRGRQLAAVAPEEMSIAIAPAIRKLVKHHQLAMSDVDLWELHEAYAVTTLYNQAQLETPWEITNVNGGAVPLGHPYGMSGIRYLGSTLLELARRGRHRAIVGVCTAGGMSTAAYLERP